MVAGHVSQSGTQGHAHGGAVVPGGMVENQGVAVGPTHGGDGSAGHDDTLAVRRAGSHGFAESEGNRRVASHSNGVVGRGRAQNGGGRGVPGIQGVVSAGAGHHQGGGQKQDSEGKKNRTWTNFREPPGQTSGSRLEKISNTC